MSNARRADPWGGGTNSRPSLTSENPAVGADAGVDTVRFRWRESNLAYQQFQRREGGCVEGAGGERRVATPLGVVGAYPEGLVYVEARAAALVDGDPEQHRLADVGELHLAERVARDLARASGAPVGGEAARLGRIDLASELRFADGREGQAFLHALGALDVPWCKMAVDGCKRGAVETVAAHGVRGRTISLRAYDKGVEAGTHSPGERIRVERQKRYRKAREPHVAQVRTLDLRSVYLGREFAKLADLPSVAVCDVVEAIRVVGERAESVDQRDRLTAFLVWGGARDEYRRPTWYRRASELRALGVALDPSTPDRLVVPVGRHLQTLAAAWPQAA